MPRAELPDPTTLLMLNHLASAVAKRFLDLFQDVQKIVKQPGTHGPVRPPAITPYVQRRNAPPFSRGAPP